MGFIRSCHIRLLAWAVFALSPLSAAPAASINVVVDRLSGEIALHNPGAAPFGIAAYSITSPVASLNSANLVWTSIADTYDASGSGSVDPDDEWVEFTMAGSMTDLSEGEFDGDGGAIAPGQFVSLGLVYDTAFPENLSAQVVQTDLAYATVNLIYRLPGDYNNDLSVTQADYSLWLANYGSLVSLAADGNLNGKIDVPDYVVWRENLGLSVAGAAQAAGADDVAAVPAGGSVTNAGDALLLPPNGGIGLAIGPSQVPEPSTLLMLWWGAAILFAVRRGRYHVRCCRSM